MGKTFKDKRKKEDLLNTKQKNKKKKKKFTIKDTNDKY